jgi:ABC-2 type transport system permease protein
MTARRTVWEVARRELIDRSRSRAWRISMIVLLILSVGGAIAAARLSGHTPSDDVGLVGARSVALAPAVRLQARAEGRRVHIRPLVSESAASRELRDGTIDVALIDGTRLLVEKSRSQPAVRVVQDAVKSQGLFDRLRNSGLSEAKALRALSPSALPVHVLEPGARNLERNRGLIFIGAVALFTALLFYGQAVAQGVTEEKSSRVVELLLTTVQPRRLLTGKVLGIGLLGLVQLCLAGVAALIAGRLAGGAGLPSAAPETVALVLLWFVLGFILYSFAFAAAGALVSRQEDLQSTIVPITVVMTGAYFLSSLVANGDPNGTMARVTAFLPPFAPMVVPARMVLGDMNGIEFVASVVVDLLATAGLIVLAARVYERAILRIGAPLKWSVAVAGHPRGLRPGIPRSKGTELMNKADTQSRPAGVPDTGRRDRFDLPVRVAAVVLLLGGVVSGLSHPVAIAMLALGLLLVVVLESRKRRPGRRSH